MYELESHKMADGSVITLSLWEGRGVYVVAQYDKNDIEMWEHEFFEESEARTEYHKRIENPVDQRSVS